MRLLPALLVAAFPLAFACPGSSTTPKPKNFPSADEFVAKLEARQSAARSFKALDNRMDYRVDDERIKTDVHVMGERGAKIRLNALNPDGVRAADLACDGINFAFEDLNKNCQLIGPCTADAIGSLLRVSLEPDDFLALAIGSAPMIPNATANVEWNSKNGTAVLKLLANDNSQSQEIILDGKNATYDVLRATVRDAKGGVEWTLENKEFQATADGQGAAFRIPDKTRFEQPKAKGDLKIRWAKRELNVEIDPDSFVMEMTPGLPECGRKPAPAP